MEGVNVETCVSGGWGPRPHGHGLPTSKKPEKNQKKGGKEILNNMSLLH